MDVVYFVRRYSHDRSMAHQSDDLRYSLRSLADNFTGLGRVWILGGARDADSLPAWLDRRSIQWHPGGRVYREVDSRKLAAWDDVKHLQTWAQWQAIAEVADHLSDRFVIMNDDFYLMRKMAELPNEHRGPILDFAEARRFTGRATTAKVMERTARWVLDEYGVDPADQVAYETHGPLTVARHSFRAVMTRAGEAVAAGKLARVAKRSLYGNAVRLPARLATVLGNDGKVHGNDDPIPDHWVLSSSDASFRHGTGRNQIGGFIRRRFPDPCRFEIA